MFGLLWEGRDLSDNAGGERGHRLTNPETETANKAEYLKALIASGGPGLVIFAVIVGSQITLGALGIVLWLIKTLWGVV